MQLQCVYLPTLLPKMENLLLVNFMPFLLVMFMIPKLASGKRSANSTHFLPPGHGGFLS